MLRFNHGGFETETPGSGRLCQRAHSPQLGHTSRAVPACMKLLRYFSMWCTALDCPLQQRWEQKV